LSSVSWGKISLNPNRKRKEEKYDGPMTKPLVAKKRNAQSRHPKKEPEKKRRKHTLASAPPQTVRLGLRLSKELTGGLEVYKNQDEKSPAGEGTSTLRGHSNATRAATPSKRKLGSLAV